ncbi:MULTISPECIES: alpha/beta hydrolase [Streptomyces violaceusniger group]|uniref:Acyl-CoA:diacylglycerol acyltransferase n=2 Tax=Streptomyces javensis TaxID=114698 RepID=A0ABP4HY19_9ACTN|nr:alpha/beta hydrolase-fold protein [Streptomyces javensis]MBI0315556.1 esterase [Streptomyces javensis]
MKVLTRAVLRGATALVGVVALCGMFGPPAQAATAPPHFADGFGLTVVSQPRWADDKKRTFTFTVRSDQVPAYSVLPGQVSGEHTIMVTLPSGYDGAAATRYPVHYTLHGAPEYPEAPRNKVITERSTEGVPLITVTPNGGGRGWYSNWVNPGELGRQNWETFHLDQLIPLVDANLRTIPAKEGRAISGHSMGGFGAFHYAEHRPELFRYVGSFSGDLDLLNPEIRAAVVGSEVLSQNGTPTVAVDAVFGPPVWPLDGVWNEQSPAQHVGSLRGMGVAMYTGDGGDLTVDPILAVAENRVRQTALVTAANLTAEGIPHRFVDYGDGSSWAEGCTGKHSQQACLQADMDDFVKLITK